MNDNAGLVLSRLRRLLLAVLVIGMGGTLTELLLLAHYEDSAQIIPLALIVFALAVAAWHVARPSPGSVRALQGAMMLFLCAGIVGVGLHFQGAAAFQLEIDPSQSWGDVLRKAVRAHAPPLLAPGVMLQLGLIGLIYTYRHRVDADTSRLRQGSGEARSTEGAEAAGPPANLDTQLRKRVLK